MSILEQGGPAPHPSGPALPAAINALHQSIAEHPDPQAKQEITQALQILLKVQARDMQSAATQQQNPVLAALRG